MIRDKVKISKRSISKLKKEIDEYWDHRKHLSWSKKKNKYVMRYFPKYARIEYFKRINKYRKKRKKWWSGKTKRRN